MATTLKLRRGTTAEHSTFTGAVGEVTVDTDKDVIVVHDGSTAGGFPALRAGSGASVSSVTNSGNLTFTGTGNRILGDFSNATIANRVMFQTSTVNGLTLVRAIPNGTATQSNIAVTNNSDPANCSVMQIVATATFTELASGINGTGTYLPMAFSTGGSEAMRIDTNRNVQIGTTTADGQVHIKAAAGQGVPLTLTNTDAGGNPQVVVKGSRTYQIGTGNASSGFAGQLFFYDGTAAATRMLIDSSGNVGIGTSSPAQKLDIVGSIAQRGDNTRLLSYKTDGTIIAEQGNGSLTGDPNGYGITTRGAFPLLLGTNNTERMRIDSAGNVGIGTSSTTNGRFRVFGPDSANLATIGGNSMAVRFNISSTVSTIEGVDGTGVSSYQPLYLGGSFLGFAIAGTERARIDASGFTQFNSNLVMPYQGAPTSKAAAATLTGAELVTGILNTTGTTYTITLPTGANIEGALTWAGNNVCLDFFVINTASGTITIGANGNTTLGSLTIATGTSAHFRIRRTAANTFTVYRL
jgi:hypothetical protein